MDTNNNITNLPTGNPPQGPQTFSPNPAMNLGQQPMPVAGNQVVVSRVETPVTPPSNPIIKPDEPNNPQSINPVPVVRVLSPRGVEYVFLIISLFTAAASLIGAIISLIEGQTSFNVLAYPTAALIVSLPIFALLFLRLKKAEINSTDARLDPSKRRSTQFTQIVSFLICFFVLIGVISAIFAHLSGTYDGSMMKLILDALVVEVIIGGILFYYWYDEHRQS